MRLLLLSLVLGLSVFGCAPSGGGGGGNNEDPGGEGEGGEGEGMVELPPEAEGLVAIDIGPKRAMLRAGVPQQFNAIGKYDGAADVDISHLVTWTSSDESILSFDDDTKPGNATVHSDGRVSISAKLGEISGTLGFGSCYPDYDGTVNLDWGHVMPPLSWDGAYKPDGTTFLFSLEDVYCDNDRYGNYSIIIMIVGAGWCGACSAFAQRLAPRSAAIEAAGGLIVYLEIEDSNGDPATSEWAQEHLSRLIQDAPGIRVGDDDGRVWGLPTPGVVRGAGIARSLPTVFVVRRSDMSVIANQNVSNFELPFIEIAENPDHDWSQPPVPMFENKCDGPDEPFEPNDTVADAKTLPVGETVNGGICTEGADFYQVDVQGDWRIDMALNHAVGDLDVVVWNVERETALAGADGRSVGSESASDMESFTHSGPAIIRVFGFGGTSADYELTLTEL